MTLLMTPENRRWLPFVVQSLVNTSKEPVYPRVELILKIIIILLIIFRGFIKSKALLIANNKCFKTKIGQLALGLNSDGYDRSPACYH